MIQCWGERPISLRHAEHLRPSESANHKERRERRDQKPSRSSRAVSLRSLRFSNQPQRIPHAFVLPATPAKSAFLPKNPSHAPGLWLAASRCGSTSRENVTFRPETLRQAQGLRLRGNVHSFPKPFARLRSLRALACANFANFHANLCISVSYLQNSAARGRRERFGLQTGTRFRLFRPGARRASPKALARLPRLERRPDAGLPRLLFDWHCPA
jgi:hypothetical protein